MNYLLFALLSLMPPSQASHCPESSDFKFGDLVKITSSSKMESTKPDFVKGLTGEVTDKYYSEYANACDNRIVYVVSVCTKNKACYTFSFCRHDLELVPK